MFNKQTAVSSASTGKYLWLGVIQRAVAVTGLLAGGASIADAAVEDLKQVSSTSPFGALGDCGNFPGIGGGINFLDSEVEPWLDVNPTSPDNIVAFWQQDRWSDGGARGNVAGVSFDGGDSWQIVPIPGITVCPETDPGPWQRASDPWVSFSPDGTLHQMSLVFDTDPEAGFGANAMVVSKSEDGGLTWSDPITLIQDEMPRFLNDKNSLTADPNDENFVYAVWDRLEISGAEAVFPETVIPGRGLALGVGLYFKGPIYFARSTDGGETWEPARKIYETGGLDQTIGNQIVVLPEALSGTVIDFFTELKNVENSDQEGPGFNFNLAFIRSSDKGRSWRPRGRASIVAQIFSSGTITPDLREPVRDASILFDVAVDPNNGALYTVWQDRRFNNIEEVAFSMSTDDGSTWSTPVKINKTPGNSNQLRRQAFLPSVAVAGDGTVAVTYYDFRNDGSTGELADYWGILCSSAHDCSDPTNWSEERLTDASFDYLQAPFARGLFLGDYEGLAADDLLDPNSSTFVAAFGIAGPTDPATIFFRRFSPPLTLLGH